VHQRASQAGKRVQAWRREEPRRGAADANMEFAANHITAAGYGFGRPALHGDLGRGGRGDAATP